MQEQLQIYYINYISLYILYYTILHCTTLHHTLILYTTLHHITPHHYNCNYNYITLYYTTTRPYITLHSLHHHKYNYNYTTLIRIYLKYNSIILKLQLHYTTLHPIIMGEIIDKIIIITNITIPKNIIPINFQSINGFALQSVIHNNQIFLKIIFSEISATTLCDTPYNYAN